MPLPGVTFHKTAAEDDGRVRVKHLFPVIVVLFPNAMHHYQPYYDSVNDIMLLLLLNTTTLGCLFSL